MATNEKNTPENSESYNGSDNQFQQGSFSRSEKKDNNDPDKDADPGDAYSEKMANGGIYDSNEGSDPET
ncbi:MAG: hypothetical protein EOO89_28930 [Pedobacter sp.]|nr:MAG: hypothetical protein EOO89_28930 [Pedobacter sp.]